MDRHTAREHMLREFWTQLLEESERRTPLSASIGPSWQHYVKKKVQPRGLAFHYSVRADSAWVEVCIDRGRTGRERNKDAFGRLPERRCDIEGKFQGGLRWQPLDCKRAYRIYHEIPGRALAERGEWAGLHDETVERMIRFHAAISPWLDRLGM